MALSDRPHPEERSAEPRLEGRTKSIQSKNGLAEGWTPAFAGVGRIAGVRSLYQTGINRPSTKLGEGGFGAVQEDEGALPLGDFLRGGEGAAGLVLVVAVEREEAQGAPAIEFRHIEADSRLVDGRDGAIDIGNAVRGTPSLMHELSRQSPQ